MGFLKRFGRAAPATATAYVENPEEIARLEKTGADTALENAHSDHVHPEIERAVRSKFDWHLVPLVTGLCSFVLMSSVVNNLLIPYDRSPCVPRSVKYRVKKPFEQITSTDMEDFTVIH